MIWGTPVAAWALLALAVPILIHTLVSRRAKPTPFPTLRFIPHTRLVSIERRALEDIALLMIRLCVLTAAVAAVAGPFLITRSRRGAWEATTIRAEVVSGVASRGDQIPVVQRGHAVCWHPRGPGLARRPAARASRAHHAVGIPDRSDLCG